MTSDTTRGTDRSFLFVLGSSRPDGNTETLARTAAQQLPAGVPQRWVDLAQLPLPDFQDGRHETVMSNDDEAVGAGLVTTLNHSAAYTRMRFGGVLFGNGSRPGQVRDDERAALRAKTFFQREAPLARFA
ncbi:NAD(P)H-dependent oxidoreductase [Streptomyces scopuliridis]|uniref:NAD(P)H-dependent oxidoreductase n=1 Tax=Streptomyces scopuliridis TaxID=452529 RepID=UPI0036B92689